MTIGQALKQVRVQTGLTQTQMAAGIVTTSFYSKVERGVHSIDADVLVKILSANHVDVVDFFQRLNFQSFKENPNFELINQISFAQNRKDLKTLDQIVAKIKSGEVKDSFQLEFRLQNAYAWVTHSNQMVTPEMKQKIKAIILNKDRNRISYHLLSQTVIVFDLDDAYYLVDLAFKAYKKNNVHDTFTL
ncbi:MULTISPECIES: helix-turn-helix domain-containing protein [Lactobacillus]|uniref:helix-turn-helix domain-containing protein n=1 Tax=Lactobacillus TaxID=1578 RepID=UPI001F302879|nr:MULTISPECIES: helix-turn-helix transcriptional regulator [Lactobacillus]